MKTKRFLCTLLVMALALSLLPAEAQAVTLGDFEVTGTKGGYSYASNVLTFTAPGEYTVAMASGVASTDMDRIVVSAGTADSPVKITLDGVDIKRTGPGGSCAFDIQGGSVVELTLEADTHNTLVSGPNFAGLNMDASATLTIKANGTGASTGALAARGDSFCAGIGGGQDDNGGTVYISGGTINVQGGVGAAGIGGGFRGNGGAVYIQGGTVYAQGGNDGAGIGGGEYGNGGTITITGGTINSQGSADGTGIGDGSGGSGGAVYISGGSVYAQGFTDIHGTLMNRLAAQGGVNVYRATLTLTPDISIPQTAIGFSGAAAGYGSGGLVTDGGTLYFYLPAGNAGAAYGGNAYTATVATHHNNAFTIAGVGYVFRRELTNLTVDNKDTMIRADAPYTATLTPGTGWCLPGSIGITMGGVTLATGYSYNSTTGILTIDAGVTGDIVVTAVGGAGREIELRVDATHIQWRYEGEPEWLNLVALADITGPQGTAGQDGADGREVELRVGATHIQWRYEGNPEWHNLVALSAITGPPGSQGADGTGGEDGTDGQNGRDGAHGQDGRDGADGNGIADIRKTASDGNADTYTITFTNGAKMTFSVTNGRDGAGIASGMIDENGALVFTLTDGTKLNVGRISEQSGTIPASGAALPNQKGPDATAIVALVVAVVALLSHLGWLIPLLRQKD